LVCLTRIVPVPEPDSYDLAWNTPLRVFADEGVLANDYDADGDVLDAYVDEDVSHGYLDLNDEAITLDMVKCVVPHT